MPFGYPVLSGNFVPAGAIRPTPGLMAGVSTAPTGLMPMAPIAPVPMNPDTTGYFGNLSPNLSEEVLTAILSCCGGFKRLKRPVDPSNGKPKPFALVEFEGVADLNRAFRVFHDFVLDHRHLNIKIEGGRSETNEPTESDLKIYESIYLLLIGKKMTGGGSMDWLEKRISIEREKEREREREKEREKEKETGRNLQSERSEKIQQGELRGSQRNYSDLIDDPGEPQFTRTSGTANSSANGAGNISAGDALLTLRERERRWEGKVRDMERELRKDLEKDAERAKRHEKEILALKQQISNYSDASESSNFGSLGRSIFDPRNGNTGIFMANREKWRNGRENAKEKEKEIFAESLKIRSEIQANSLQKQAEKQREFIENCLPVEREELFAYPVAWGELRGDVVQKLNELCRERVAAYFKHAKEGDLYDKIGEFVFEQVNRQQSATSASRELSTEPAFLAVCGEDPRGEAELLVMIIWRWLIYLTSQF